MSRIELTALAADDLAEIWYYISIEQKSPENADALIDEIDERFQLLARQPMVGESVDTLRKDTRRSIVKQRFLVYYEPRKDGIVILRVLHGARLIRPKDLSDS